MIPTTHLTSTFDTPFDMQMSPELRRMDMINRARREERDAIAFGLTRRQGHGMRHVSHRSTRNANIGVRMVSGLRDGIGTMLIAAGQRIQSA